MSNTVDDQAARPESGRAGRGKTALVSVLILLAGVALMVLIFKTEPTATRGDVARETAMLVEVRTAERGRFSPVIEVMGQVVPAREVTLQPRVSGRVIELAEAFEPGGQVAEDTALLRIDPADYQAALRQRRSELAQARADLELEQGRQAVAEQDFELLGEELDEGNRHLVLRQPQLKQARAQVDFAEAALRRAELDLQRTRISAPFDAQILSRDVATGSQVSTGDSLARLVATDRYWVSASVPLSQLRWLRFAERDGEEGAPVTLRHEAAWGPSQSRQGRLQRLVGELDANARLARVLVSVEDPLALRAEAGTPSLILGAFVRTAIEGRALDDVVRLDRSLLRREDTVWVMEDGALDIRDVTVLLRDDDYVYLSEGLDQGDQVVATDLATVVDGAALRLEDAAGAETME
ncbi:efflux RND transporter periplasmic adaptor subunit [Alloalcanivorax venustensis]|jgi:RND family efflux transporter MFP subunit|uniref:efflux RND transporter periplasmic adaptor subunit n=2 Tax=Alloalcanivorax venustensis TaxID=172371 RepID=UPI001BD2751C|nr:MAG: efflux RND transporter periplasmic adaptor subunit [Alcanivorax sp.]